MLQWKDVVLEALGLWSGSMRAESRAKPEQNPNKIRTTRVV